MHCTAFLNGHLYWIWSLVWFLWAPTMLESHCFKSCMQEQVLILAYAHATAKWGRYFFISNVRKLINIHPWTCSCIKYQNVSQFNHVNEEVFPLSGTQIAKDCLRLQEKYLPSRYHQKLPVHNINHVMEPNLKLKFYVIFTFFALHISSDAIF